METEKILHKVFDCAVVSLPQLPTFPVASYTSEEEMKRHILKGDTFIFNLCNNRKREVTLEIYKITLRCIEFEIQGLMPTEEMFSVAEDIAVKIASFIRVIFMTSKDAKDALLRVFRGMNEYAKAVFIDDLCKASEHEDSNQRVRDILRKSGIIPNHYVNPDPIREGSRAAAYRKDREKQHD